MRIREIAQAKVRYGYRKIRVRLNREGWDVGKHLVYRLCKEEGLMLKRMKPAGASLLTESLEVIQQTASVILAALEPPVSEDVTSEELEAVAA
jgi:hypothetical protein